MPLSLASRDAARNLFLIQKNIRKMYETDTTINTGEEKKKKKPQPKEKIKPKKPPKNKPTLESDLRNSQLLTQPVQTCSQ